MTRIRAVLVVGLTSFMFTVSSAGASTITTINTTLGCWAQLDPQTSCAQYGVVAIGDKTFVGQGGNLGNYLPVVFTWSDPGTPTNYSDDSFSVFVNLLGQSYPNVSLSYYVYINDPFSFFRDVTLDSTGQGQVTKAVAGGFNFNDLLLTLYSVNGSTVGPAPISGQAIRVVDTLNGNFSNLTNTFTQTQVPEPASLLLLGSGLAALAWRRSRP